MKRFFFSLRRHQNVTDHVGLVFETELQAFQAARSFALDLSDVRPALRRNTWVSMSWSGSSNEYCVSIE